jgi:hypothetical protein
MHPQEKTWIRSHRSLSHCHKLLILRSIFLTAYRFESFIVICTL